MTKTPIPAMCMRDRPATMRPIEFEVVTWYHDVSPQTVPEHLFNPKFWALHARSMRVGHEILVKCHGAWRMELEVIEANNTGARVAELGFTDLTAVRKSPHLGALEGEDYKINWISPGAKWQIVRVSDGTEMRRGMEKGEAQAWIKDRVAVEGR